MTLKGSIARYQLTYLALIGALAVSIVSCQAAATRRTIQLQTLNDSGVTGSIMLIAASQDRTQVEVSVNPAGNPDMPAHVHPGTCANLVPQPKYPLQNVINGTSTTVVPASLDELLAGDLAINLHTSNADMGTYTACAELR